MKRNGGFTLIEIIMALALLAIVLSASTSYIQQSRADDASHWEEFCAHELALSVLHELRSSAPTPGEETEFKLSGPASEHLATTLADSKIHIRVIPAAGNPSLKEARVVVSWMPSISRGSTRRATLERRAIVGGVLP